MKPTNMSGELAKKETQFNVAQTYTQTGKGIELRVTIVEGSVACVFKLGVSNRRHSNVSC